VNRSIRVSLAADRLAPTAYLSAMPTPPVFAIILAAGASHRFGSDKLLTTFAGKPLLSHTLDIVLHAISEGTLAGGLVVARDEDSALISLVRSRGLAVVIGRPAGDGLSQSIRAGLGQLESTNAGAALLFHGDQPEVRLDVVRALVRGWSECPSPIFRPRYLDDPEPPGHPVLLDRSVWPLAGEMRGDSGLAPILRRHPHLVTVLDVPGSNPDIDTPDDLIQLARQP
jgi:molybdenum cofactor cytidylyltransferase